MHGTPTYQLIASEGSATAPFLRAQTDLFLIEGAPAFPDNEIRRLHIGHDSSAAGIANNWYLEAVQLRADAHQQTNPKDKPNDNTTHKRLVFGKQLVEFRLSAR